MCRLKKRRRFIPQQRATPTAFKELEEIKQRRHNRSSVMFGVDVKKMTTY